jgi:O-antigen ligase
VIHFALRGQTRLKPYALAVVGLLLLALIAGGASQQNALPATLVEICALATIPFSVLKLFDSDNLKLARGGIFLIVIIAMIPVIQLIPLPANIWAHIPGHGLAASAYAAISMPAPWLPISTSPLLTQRSALSLSVPVALFLATLNLSLSERRLCISAVFVATILGLILGGLQLSGGADSLFYLYNPTNNGALVGLFSNRNHEASLLVCALPLTAAFVAQSQPSRGRRGGSSLNVIIGVGLAVMAIIALGAVRSRAGLLLLGPALALSALIVWRSGTFGGRRLTAVILGAVVLVSLLIVGVMGLSGILERFTTDPVGDIRFTVAGAIADAGMRFLPFGSGLGTFDVIYRSIEPNTSITQAYLNHAHDDYLELFLETGVLGIVAFVSFFAWWANAAWRAWTNKGSGDKAVAQAGSAMVALLLLHSVLDYPLRTAALSGLFGFACACMIRPSGEEPVRIRVRKSR